MTYYSISSVGTWPNEKYLYQIDTNTIDIRYGLLPIKVLTSPQFSEDNNFSVKSYNPPNFNNNVIGLSCNKPYIYTENNGELNASIESNLSFSWTPSSLRTKNYGNMLNGILLNTSDNRHFTVISYPSELFLYPLSAGVIGNYETLVTGTLYLSAYTQQQWNQFSTDVMSTTATLGLSTLEEPLVRSFIYTLSSFVQYQSFEWGTWYQKTSSGVLNTYLEFTSSVDVLNVPPLSSFSYISLENVLCSFYLDIDDYNIDYNFAITLTNYVSSFGYTNKVSSVEYTAYYQNLTSKDFALETETVLLSTYDFQLYSIEYGRLIKLGHNQYLSTIPLTGAINNFNLKSLSYTLSGAIVNSNKNLIKFSENNNPIFEKIILEERKNNIIRPDTVKLSYLINFLDSDSALPNKIETIGDEYDDMVLNADRSIEASYIVGYDDNKNKLTFQLLQSGIDLDLPMEHPRNCVLSAILNLNDSSFEYINQRFTTFDAPFASYTPISGAPNTNLTIRYIANTSFDEENNLIGTNVLNLSSNYGYFSLNSSISINQKPHNIRWSLKNPPYYYNFKNSYIDNNNQKYNNKNTLSFYLSSELFSNTIIKPSNSDASLDYSQVHLYTSIYSEYDIMELPLKEYSFNDLIRYELVFRDDTLLVQNVSAYIVFADNKEDAILSNNVVFYDINSSPYIPAVSGSFLRINYDLDNGGAIFSVKPSLKTKIGVFDAFWGTTFSSAIDYQPRNFIIEPSINTLQVGISSATVSVADLTGGLNTFLDLTDTFITWNYSDSTYPLLLVNRTSSSDIGGLTTLEPNSSYLFNIANTVEIVGISNEDIAVTLYSEAFNVSSTVLIEPTLFDLYYENRLLIEFEPIDIKNKIKILKANVRVPFSDKKFFLDAASKIKWTWTYDDIETGLTMPVSAYYVIGDTNVDNLNDLLTIGLEYEIDTIALSEEAGSLYFVVDTGQTINEETYPLSAFIELYDKGDVYNSVALYEVNSYPDPAIFSTDFFVTYPNFPTYQIANTQNNFSSLTRPPNGTNIFRIVPFELKSQNISISSLKWNIKTTIIPNSSIEVPYSSEENITLSANVSGFYDNTVLIKDFNLFNTTSGLFYNNQLLTGISSVPILTFSEFINLSSYLTSPDLVINNTVLNSISAFENITPLATSLNVITTSFYITSFERFEDLDIVRNIDNFYFLTYIETLSTDNIIINDGGDPTNYLFYSVNYWLSSQNFIISDNSTDIITFSSQYIAQKNNIIYYQTLTTPTTSFQYILTQKFPEKNAYVIHNVSMVAENVSIENWEYLYNFSKEIQIIITNEQEFVQVPKLRVVPKHIWIPDWTPVGQEVIDRYESKKTKKYVTYLPSSPVNNVFSLLSGITYGNRLSCQEYHMLIENVQDFPIDTASDPISIVIGVGNQNIEILDSQIIDSPTEYVLNNLNIEILNFRIPCYPDMYEPSGMTVYVTAFNRFFPEEGGFQYYGIPSLTATELVSYNYPITSQTFSRLLTSVEELYYNPQLVDYDSPKLLFYPKLISLDLDKQRIVQVKQILEIDPIESPVEIELDKSGVIYELKSEFWTVSSIVPAMSSQTYDIFRLSVGDSTIPLTISDYDESTLVLTATAMVATKIFPTTFANYSSSEYTEDREIWGTVYQMALGNDNQAYEILFSSIDTLSSYNVLAVNDNLILDMPRIINSFRIVNLLGSDAIASGGFPNLPESILSNNSISPYHNFTNLPTQNGIPKWTEEPPLNWSQYSPYYNLFLKWYLNANGADETVIGGGERTHALKTGGIGSSLGLSPVTNVTINTTSTSDIYKDWSLYRILYTVPITTQTYVNFGSFYKASFLDNLRPLNFAGIGLYFTKGSRSSYLNYSMVHGGSVNTLLGNDSAYTYLNTYDQSKTYEAYNQWLGQDIIKFKKLGARSNKTIIGLPDREFLDKWQFLNYQVEIPTFVSSGEDDGTTGKADSCTIMLFFGESNFYLNDNSGVNSGSVQFVYPFLSLT